MGNNLFISGLLLSSLNGYQLPATHWSWSSAHERNSVETRKNAMRDNSAQKDISLNSRWKALSDLNPVKHVEDIQYHENSEIQEKNYGVPLVNIAGIWGTICFDGLDQDTLDFLCRQLHFPDTYWGSVNLYQSVSHFNQPFIEYPVLLNGLKCIKHASEFDDCTSEPMGYQHCESYQDLLLGCIPIN